MSYQLLKADVLFYQRFLKANGFYNYDLDGVWGEQTNKSDNDFVNSSEKIAAQYGKFDVRSEMNIITLIPKAQVEARKFLAIAKKMHKDVRILSGTRTYQEQNNLYRQGRFGNTSAKITNAKGGQSNHNFGIAWDVGLFTSNGSYDTDDTNYISFAKNILPQLPKIEWGGNWQTFKDNPHYQLIAVSESVSAIRELFENGKPYIA